MNKRVVKGIWFDMGVVGRVGGVGEGFEWVFLLCRG